KEVLGLHRLRRLKGCVVHERAVGGMGLRVSVIGNQPAEWLPEKRKDELAPSGDHHAVAGEKMSVYVVKLRKLSGRSSVQIRKLCNRENSASFNLRCNDCRQGVAGSLHQMDKDDRSFAVALAQHKKGIISDESRF